MAITHHPEVEQGSDEWFEMRRGILTASEVKNILSKTLKISDNDKSRAHVAELAAQRISGHVEPSYIGDDMLRGKEDEIIAREIYAEKFGEVSEVGFITRDDWGFTLGYSPDGLVGDTGLLEIKSRRQKFHVETIATLEVPEEHRFQVQAGLLVAGRAWCDYVSFCAGLPMVAIRVEPDPDVQAAIVKAAALLEKQIAEKVRLYHENLATLRCVETQRPDNSGEII